MTHRVNGESGTLKLELRQQRQGNTFQGNICYLIERRFCGGYF